MDRRWPRAVACASLCAVLVSGCETDRGAIGNRPYDLDKMAGEMGMRPFTFPRGVFQPGTFVRLNKDGAISSSPVGSLASCAPAAKLAPVKGAGLSGKFLSAAKSGLRIDLGYFGQYATNLKARLGSDSYAVLVLDRSYSIVEFETTIRDAVNSYIAQMSPGCRDILYEPAVSILSEVFYATKGSRMQFFRGDGVRINLGTQDMESVVRAFADAGSARVDSGDLTFDDDLPLFYTAVRPTLAASRCSFDLKAIGEPNYLACVRVLAIVQQLEVLAEASRTLRREFARETKSRQFTVSPAIVKFMLEVDPDNGHGLYYDGTLTRWMHMDNRSSVMFLESHIAFRRYLQIEPSIAERDGDGEACYARGRGYCAERTAWINHQMANDLFQLAGRSTGADAKRENLRLAKHHAEACIKVRPACFSAVLQGIPANQLIARANEQLEKLGGPK